MVHPPPVATGVQQQQQPRGAGAGVLSGGDSSHVTGHVRAVGLVEALAIG